MRIERKYSNHNSLKQPEPENTEPRAGAPAQDPPPLDRRTVVARAGREAAERLVALAAHLAPEDRALVHAVFADGRTVAEVARLAGRSPRSVRARLARLMARIADPLFAWLAVHEHALSPEQRTVARATLLQGRRIEDVARERGLTYHEARALRQAVVTLAHSRLPAGAVTSWRGSRPARPAPARASAARALDKGAPRTRRVPRQPAPWRTNTSNTPTATDTDDLHTDKTGGAR